jgi:glutathione-independent formaldehyde dehydrogenase
MNFPELADPHGKKLDHGVILKIITTNICGSDQHIYHGRFAAPQGMVLGHEMTGEIIELGRDVHFLKKGDIVSVPFNVSCGRCRNCKERHTDVCMNVNDKVDCGAYGFNLGGWQGGQADYMMVPYADWNLLKFPDSAQAMAKIRDLTLLSDILPTGYHGYIEAGVRTGSTVYIAGAGPVGRCAAASARLLGASCIIVADRNKERLALVKKAGYQVVDTSKKTLVADQIEAILGHGHREVDAGVDCVGLEAHGNGEEDGHEHSESVINTLFEVVRAGGAMGIPGIYTDADPLAPKTDMAKKGELPLAFSKAWIKSPKLTGGQAPIMKYNRDLMMAILWDRMPYLGEVVNTEIIALEDAPKAYETFSNGSPKQFVIDPHGSVKKAA